MRGRWGRASLPDVTTASLDALLAERYSCREFADTPVDPATVDEILELAGRTPSWCNTQPWHVHVSDPATTDRWRAELAEHLGAGMMAGSDLPFPSRYAGVFDERRKAAAWQLYEAVGIEFGDRAASLQQTMRNFDFFGAPHVAIITTEADLGPYGAVDCGLFVQSFLLAARSRGIDAVPQAALAMQAGFFREQLGLPEHRQVVVGISFGHALPEAAANDYRTPRQPLADLRTWV